MRTGIFGSYYQKKQKEHSIRPASSGLVRMTSVRCVPLTATHYRLWLAWSREHALWIPQQWACVIFSLQQAQVAAVAEWYRYRIVACLVTSSIPVPLKKRRVGQRCTLNLSRAETSSRWCGVVVRRGGASSGVVHVT
ncbi:uncharacterized protein TNCV_1325741 [Trichonephila clavipes]|nr:uncharacterized protein TNCV_1325741 [Trichonephila clavipes]